MSTSKQKRKYPRVYAKIGTHSLTKQSFKDECNINKIMAKFQKTGAINHYMAYAEEYGDASPVELSDAQQIIINAQTMFDDLPSKLRKKFNNKPEEFLEFVQNPENLAEMRKIGLANQVQEAPTQKQSESKETQDQKESET
nr:MAG: internal scaffolding protein [Microvirus sp.]